MKRLFILLDEVTSVRGWWRVLRYYVNTGVLDRAVVIATGSLTVGLLKTSPIPPGLPGDRAPRSLLPRRGRPGGWLPPRRAPPRRGHPPSARAPGPPRPARGGVGVAIPS
ncbi:MAG: hypothetical protein OWQ51_10505 [Pyrobaculum arsenaticum]|uniref:hypothetical protein n=1 Tax=Pyrobaculum arsenaticum TaxID=121277 RepID=UPI002273D85E|nr:hypothetical protein [Pyrobaculum arsenaticum]